MKRQHFFFKNIVISFLLCQLTFASLPRYEIIDLGTLGGLESRVFSPKSERVKSSAIF